MSNVTLSDMKELIGEVVDLSDTPLQEDSVLGESFSVDSQEMLRILSRIESQYEFRFELQDVINLKTVGDLLKTVQRRAAEVS